MIDLNDELLGAYLDDELGEETRAQVESELAGNAGARVRLDRLRAVDAAVRSAFPLQPVGEVRALAAQDPKVVQFPKRGSYGRGALLMTAMAAGVAGLAFGPVLPKVWQGSVPTVTSVAVDGQLAAVLDREPSGTVIRQDGREFRVLLSFDAADGRACRQYSVQAETRGGEGLACREAGAWTVVAWDGTGSTSGSGYHTAGASDAIDAAVTRLGGGDALDEATEKDRIRKTWAR
ncbi:MAG: hypothetical protein RLZZ200_962 [Pseudomonadota bacterium]|jgi:hypothetical protein